MEHSPNVSHPCGLKYFLLRSTSFTNSTTLLPLTVSPLYFSSPFSIQAMLGSAFIFRINSSALVFIVFGTLSNISSFIASFFSVAITAGGDVDTLDTTGLGLLSSWTFQYRVNYWSYSLRGSSVDRTSLSSMDSICLPKVSMTFTRCSTGGFGRL